MLPCCLLILLSFIVVMLCIRIAIRVLESDSARLDQVLEQFAKLAAHYLGVEYMEASLEKRWAKMDQKLFLVAYVLHPHRRLKYINPELPFSYTFTIAEYASTLYDRFFTATGTS